MPANIEEKQEVPIHDLFTREIRPLHNWNEWLERWQAAVTIEEMLGLLHVGFEVPMGTRHWEEKKYDHIDRVLFYMKMADGWSNGSLLKKAGDPDKEYEFGQDKRGYVTKRKPHGMRQILAKKAFDLLCQNFFGSFELEGSGKHGDEWNRHWELDVVTPRFFPSLVKFFRTEKGWLDEESIRIPNLNVPEWQDASHYEAKARDFVVKLSTFMWGWKEPDYFCGEEEDRAAAVGENEKLRSRIETAKPWILEVLIGLNEWTLIRERLLSLDRACLDKLKEIAFRTKLSRHLHPVIEDRKVASLDEAYFAGSRAAMLLSQRELLLREGRRLQEIRKAHEMKQKAELVIKGHSNSKKNRPSL
ncbi:MAG TPA: hypothetical protein VMT99_01240 [Candidatus Paceibacterota bacterium]|nr:hypothetical protein [Candidatus Paceibacterota bacterium]